MLLAARVGNIKRNLWSLWLPESERWTHLAHSRLTTLIMRNIKIICRCKMRQKKNKTKKTYTTLKGLCIVLQTLFAFLPGSRHKSFLRLILNKNLSFCYLINRLLTKLARLRLLDIGLFLFAFLLTSTPFWFIKVDLGQYPAILTSRLANHVYILAK